MLQKTTCRILMCRPTYFKVFYAINPWMAVNNPVDTKKATNQWNKLKETIENCGAKVEVMEPPEGAKDVPDLVFTANAAIVRGDQVYLANFTHAQRKAEWKFNDKWFRQNGFYTHFNPNIPHEGTGDALWCCKRKVLIAGVGPRSDVRALPDIQEKLQTEGDDFQDMWEFVWWVTGTSRDNLKMPYFHCFIHEPFYTHMCSPRCWVEDRGKPSPCKA
ncbi:Amidinotransferase, partial [Ostertagia ostertagi]